MLAKAPGQGGTIKGRKDEERPSVQSIEKEFKDEEKRKKERERKDEDEKKRKEKEARDLERKKRREKDQKIKEARKEADEAAETAELQAAPPLAFEKGNPNFFKDLYNIFPVDHYSAYEKLQSFSRDLNTQLSTPEIVFIGHQGQGKSSLIEALVGLPTTAVGFDGITRRPLFLNLLYNADCAKPKWTLKRDPVLTEFDHDTAINPADLPAQLEKRNKVVTTEPIFLQCEHKETTNLTLIDTPGLLEQDQGELKKDKIDQIVLNLIKPSHRIIVTVESAREWDEIAYDSVSLELLQEVDPDFQRSLFVHTNFNSLLQSFTEPYQVNLYLSGSLAGTKNFFVTLLSGKVRAKNLIPEKYKERLWQSYRRDVNKLESLNYDKTFEPSIGLHAFRKYILNRTWTDYTNEVPQMLRNLRAKKSEAEANLKRIKEEAKHLDTHNLRSIASKYVVDYLTTISALLQGTSEGNPAVNGQTLDEEKMQHGDGEWLDNNNKVVKVESDAWKIPYWNSRIYGGQQFERLLAEFKAVCEHTKMDEITSDDVATAAGHKFGNYAWAASDLAQKKSQEAFVPLIEQAISRSAYLMKRLTDIADKMLDARRGRSSGGGRKRWEGEKKMEVGSITQYPYFTYHVKDLYQKFIESTAKSCQEKCMDEFYRTSVIYWDYTEYNEGASREIDQSDPQKAVIECTKEIFKILQKRITKNVVFKLYNFFLVPMQNELWNFIQGKITSMTDQALEQTFEVTATKDKVTSYEKHCQIVVQQSEDQEQELLVASQKFSHPFLFQQ